MMLKILAGAVEKLQHRSPRHYTYLEVAHWIILRTRHKLTTWIHTEDSHG
jgi:hypothetical protein